MPQTESLPTRNTDLTTKEKVERILYSSPTNGTKRRAVHTLVFQPHTSSNNILAQPSHKQLHSTGNF